MTAKNKMLDAALGYARRGWRVFPLWCVSYDIERDNYVCTCRAGAKCDHKGKHPAVKDGVDAATTDEAQIKKWFARGDKNIGLALGKTAHGKDLWVLDVDGEQGERALLPLLSLLPATYEVKTGRGRHLYYHGASDCRPVAHKLDVRGEGGYVVAPPSLHETGFVYATLEARDVEVLDRSSLPYMSEEKEGRGVQDLAPKAAPPVTGSLSDEQTLAQGVSVVKSAPPAASNKTQSPARAKKDARGQEAARGELPPNPNPALFSAPRWAAVVGWSREALAVGVEEVRGQPAGGRSTRLNAVAYRLGRIIAGGALSRTEVERALTEAALGASDPLPEGEVRTKLASSLDAGERDPHDFSNVGVRAGKGSAPAGSGGARGGEGANLPAPNEAPREREPGEDRDDDEERAQEFLSQLDLARSTHGAKVEAELQAALKVPPKTPQTDETPPARPWTMPDSDTGLADRLLDLHGERLRYSEATGWLVYRDSGVWEESEAAAYHLATDSARRLRAEVAEQIASLGGLDFIAAQNEERAKAWKRAQSYARGSEDAGKIKAAVTLAATRPEVRIRIEELDADPLLFNASNGTVDLRTGELLEFLASDLQTQQTEVPYDPDAECPRWQRFLWEIMGGDVREEEAAKREEEAAKTGGDETGHRTSDLVTYLWKMIGYALTGSVKEQSFTLLYGDGSNGKSLFINTVKRIVGTYGQAAAFSTFLDTRANDGIRNDIACLRGARLVTAVEPNQGAKLDEGVVKQLTGDDPIKARKLYQDPFEFRPTFKVLLACNHLPRIGGNDYGIWRRVRTIPFKVSFRTRPDDPPEWPEADRNLSRALEAELPGILAWAVRGAVAWLYEGLTPPRCVMAATDAYRSDQDVFGQFLEECCELGPEMRVESKDLYIAYKEWIEDQNLRPLAKTTFLKRVAKIPNVVEARTAISRGWRGLQLKP